MGASPICPRIADASAWRGPEIATRDDWILPLTRRHLAELDHALRTARPTGTPGEPLIPRHFPLDTLADELRRFQREITFGRGFGLIRGLPVDRYDLDELATIFRGLGSHLGVAVSQNANGDLLDHIRDERLPEIDSDIGRNRTNMHLPFHTDSADIVALLCIHTARSGGASSIASSVTVHNDLLDAHSEFVGVLYSHFDWDMRGEEQEGASPVFRQPVYATYGGLLSCRYLQRSIVNSQEKTGRQLSEVEVIAIDLVQELAQRVESRFDMDLQPGDMQFLNNSTVLHSRTAYVDHDEPERRRHLLRLWLNAEPIVRPIHPSFLARRAGVVPRRQAASRKQTASA